MSLLVAAKHGTGLAAQEAGSNGVFPALKRVSRR